jgi:hypothetical protein
MEKIQRMAGRRETLDPTDDFELWMWMSMTIATHAVNAALHACGLTKSDDYYSYHVVGLYVVPPARGGVWRKEARALGDVVHVDLPPVPGVLPAAIQKSFAALKVLEDMRDPYIRKADPITPQLVARCQAAYLESMHEAIAMLPHGYGQIDGI